MFKYYKDDEGNIYAYESDGSQDAWIKPNLVQLTSEEVDDHLSPKQLVVTQEMVDSERNRRISEGFLFNDVLYQSRLPSLTHSGDWEIFSGKALEALMAVMNGVTVGDLRWSNPDEDFTWIAADNSRVPMDAQTVMMLAKTASAHRSYYTFKGSDIKSLNPIPLDYQDDIWWQ